MRSRWASLPIGFKFNFYGLRTHISCIHKWIQYTWVLGTYTGLVRILRAAANNGICFVMGILLHCRLLARFITGWKEQLLTRSLLSTSVDVSYLGVAGSIITTQVILSETNTVEIHTTNASNSTATKRLVLRIQNAGATLSRGNRT
ncbi:MAG: hypothetical protein IPF81_02325 [Bacteroidetes bacterium]|nr:hypothetical protein [Bacteroidota bacterium]